MRRRQFLKNSLAAGFMLSSCGILSCSTQKKPLNVLILGGTFFVGPAIVNAFLKQNHTVTLFNRGITNPGLFPELELIRGDREKGASSYEPLKSRHWDVVVDVWPEKSILVDEATQALQNHCDHYIFISSIAVYRDFQKVGLHETSEVVNLPEDRNQWYYSEEKLAAEQFVQDRFGENHTIIRPCAIKGWRDPAVDLYYWCLKLNRDPAILAPGSGEDPLQFIDVKDVGAFTSKAADQGLTGTYNCVGPQRSPLQWKQFLETAKAHFNSDTELVWADEEFLAANGVSSFTDLPLWAPLSEDRGFMQISNDKLLGTGFEFRTLEATLSDCKLWHKELGNTDIAYGTEEVNSGLNREREIRLLHELKIQKGT